MYLTTSTVTLFAIWTFIPHVWSTPTNLNARSPKNVFPPGGSADRGSSTDGLDLHDEFNFRFFKGGVADACNKATHPDFAEIALKKKTACEALPVGTQYYTTNTPASPGDLSIQLFTQTRCEGTPIDIAAHKVRVGEDDVGGCNQLATAVKSFRYKHTKI